MWNELWQRHRGATIGTAAGVFFGFIYLFFGFWNMLVFAFIVLSSYLAGSKAERNELGPYAAAFYHWLTERWRRFR